MTWYWWTLILILPMGYLRLVAHELSHAAAARALGLKVPWDKFWPWPHKADGRWYWGRMYREDAPGKIDDLLVSLAPLERAQIFMLAWIIPAIFWAPLWDCVFWEAMDIIHWWVGWVRRPYSDGGKVRAILFPKDP